MDQSATNGVSVKITNLVIEIPGDAQEKISVRKAGCFQNVILEVSVL